MRTAARVVADLVARFGKSRTGRPRRSKPASANAPDGAKLGKAAQPLRAALTGRAVSPPVFDVMAVLGRDELARLKDQVG
jgi:glutamyl/glutaminyl-tRNA synthetase